MQDYERQFLKQQANTAKYSLFVDRYCAMNDLIADNDTNMCAYCIFGQLDLSDETETPMCNRYEGTGCD